VTVNEGRIAGVWPANEIFFNQMRRKGGLIGVAIDPLSSHECGNQRYLAIPWLDACLSARLPKVSGDPLQAMPTDKAWLASVTGGVAVPAARFAIHPLRGAWLPNEAIAKAWMQYVKDTAVTDDTPPPAPTNVRLKGNGVTWEAEADLESGLASFIIERDGKFLAKVPEQGKNPFGRPIFQNLQYSDTPTQPLMQIRYTDTKAEPGKKHTYRVIAVNTVGSKSMPSADSLTSKCSMKRIKSAFRLCWCRSRYVSVRRIVDRGESVDGTGAVYVTSGSRLGNRSCGHPLPPVTLGLKRGRNEHLDRRKHPDGTGDFRVPRQGHCFRGPFLEARRDP
jgi:hypothetical protein